MHLIHCDKKVKRNPRDQIEEEGFLSVPFGDPLEFGDHDEGLLVLKFLKETKNHIKEKEYLNGLVK